MTCTDVRKLLPDRALGDLDAEPAAEVAAHLKECDACRAEDGGFGRTLGLLRAAPAVVPSTERRSAAVAAMARAHADQSELLLARRPRRSWAPWATAAAFLLAVVGALTVRGTSSTAFTVAHVTGRAELRDLETGRWRPVTSGTAISVGDRLVTQRDCKVRLVAGAVELLMDQDSSLEIPVAHRVALDRGRILAVAPESGAETLEITDMGNNIVRVRGRAELSLRDVRSHVGGSMQKKGAPSVLPDPKVEVRRSLVVRVQTGEAALGGARKQVLYALAGEEGKFQFEGKPETAPLQEPGFGTWIEDP
ncbi:MAG: hypothetical protein EHM91_00210 [Planctomycetota bacterium]|nr:MAG: hypothetical protein EHM91_00210 [Planctomycetota bacterium]